MAKKSKRKKHKLQSKKELELEGRKIGIELDRRHSKEDLIEELEKAEKELIDEMNDDVITDVEWDTIEDFSEVVTSSGMIFNSDFIPVDITALYESYTSNPKEFKQTAAYKFLTK